MDVIDLEFLDLKDQIIHYSMDIEDYLISNRWIEKSLNTSNEKIDIIYFIQRCMPQSFSKDYERLVDWIGYFFDKLLDLSSEEYSIDEQQLLKTYMLCFLINAGTINETQAKALILQIQNYLNNDVNDSPVSIWYVKEKLRIELLKLYNLYGDVLYENIDDFSEQIRLAKLNIENVREVAEIIDSL